MIMYKGDRKVRGLFSYSDLLFSSKFNLLFTLSTGGWKDLAEENELDRSITIYDIDGYTIFEEIIFPYEGGENSIMIDEINDVLYYFSRTSIKIYSIVKT